MSHSPMNFEENNNESKNKAKIAQEKNLKHYEDLNITLSDGSFIFLTSD